MKDTENRAPAPLALRESKPYIETRAEPWRDPDWQKFWLSMLGRSWSSLALVPASAGASADFTLHVAVNLARIGLLHLGQPIQVADGTQIPLVHLAQFESELGRLKLEKELVLIALAPIADNPITVQIAQAADAAVLCVLLDAMSSSDAKKTVDRIGAGRFLGSAVFHPHAAAGPMSAGAAKR